MAKSLYLIDGHAQIYRAYYAPSPEFSAPSGEPTRATYVFCRMLLQIVRERKPDYFGMVMDVSDETVFRKDFFPEYKANRDPAPEDLHLQADRIVQIVNSFGIPIFRESGYEADDLMATIATRLSDEPLDIYLVSSDKDLYQLITDCVRLFDPRNGKTIGKAELMEKQGHTPEQSVEVQTLSGDNTDNIPGVKGVGLKTAVKLVNKFGSAEAVLDNADQLTPTQRENVLAFAEQMPITRKLVTLKRDVPFEFDLEACKLESLNAKAVWPIFHELGFRGLKDVLREIDPEVSGEVVEQAVAERLAVTLFDDEDTAQTSVDYYTIDTKEQLAHFVEKLKTQPNFAFDTETTGLNPVAAELVGLSFSWEEGVAYYLPVRGAMGKTLERRDVIDALAPVFEDERILKVGHNLKYDLLVVMQLGISPKGIYFDTMLASFLLEPLRRSHGLDYLASTLCNHQMVPISDLIGKGKNQITIDQVEIARVSHYAGEDADFTWRLFEIFQPQVTDSHIEKLFQEIEMPLVQVLARMENNGMALDIKLLKRLSDDMAERLIDLTKRVHEEAGHEFNIDSTKQLANVLFDEQELPVVRKTKTGRSTDAETLSRLVEQSDNPIPKLILEYRELTKLKNTYLDTLPTMICAKTGRVHASFNQTGAITGRLSSNDPNLQNIPIRTEAGRRIREAFVPGSKDGVILAADYSQIELRLLAHFCKDSALIEAFRHGQDIHRTVAAEVHGVPFDQVTPQQRSAAKAVNFGIIYGQTAFGLARSLKISRGEAEAFINMYFLRYPGIRQFIDDCVSRARKQGYAETVLGRRRPVDELYSRNPQQRAFGERIAVNTVVQGSAADLIKQAMIDIDRELLAVGGSARMLCQVHDELVFEVAKDRVDAESSLLRAKMESAMKLDVPLVVDVAWGPHWAGAK